ncbi:hypothetical protein [Alkalihalobacterium sp. APHAB7]|uniref:ParM/StbA family protein n=1 Tax=Alkalihalobacterium sp. APHAB7 TaxID=3402081 RepID=UPI003AAE3240
MIIFGMDLGNKQTKLFSAKTEEKVIPSHFLYHDDLGNERTSIFNSNIDIHKYKVNFDDEPYAWGKDLHKLHMEDKFLDTISFEKRYETEEFKLLANFALAELASDFGDQATSNVLPVTVVTGVPSDDFNETDVQSIMKVLQGDHTIKRDEKDYIVRVEDVHVIPQSVGSVYNELIDSNGYMIEENESYLEEEIVVVDIGGGTVLIDVLKNMNLVNQTQFPTGIHELYDQIVTAAKENPNNSRITTYDVEQILRNGSDEKGYYFKPNKDQSNSITEIVVNTRKKYTRELVNKINRTIKQSHSIDTMLFTGGGANLIDQAKVQERYKRAIFVENSETANVTGFYKYGKAIELENSDAHKEVATTEE